MVRWLLDGLGMPFGLLLAVCESRIWVYSGFVDVSETFFLFFVT